MGPDAPVAGRILTAGRIAELSQGNLVDCEPASSYALADPADAAPDTVCIAFTRTVLDGLVARDCGLVIAPEQLEERLAGRARLLVANPRLALARLTAALASATPHPGDHRPDSATVAPGAQVHESARLAAGVVIGADARVGPGCVLGPGVTIGAGARLGSNCVLHAGVHIYPGVVLGERVVLHAGAVIGADGFGYVPTRDGPLKIHHLGGVVIGDDVEIGANTCVDSGALSPTRVGARTKLDNLVQIGHNVVLGEDCLVAGHTAIGGSTVVGNRVMIAGNSAISDHVEIGDDAVVAGMSGVGKNIPAGETWFGVPAVPMRQFTRRQYLQSRLEEIWNHVRERRTRD